MSNKIVPLIPKHLVYVEPFAGSGAILFAKPIPEDVPPSKYVEVLNDTNHQLINLYTQATLHEEEFIKTIQSLPFSKAIFDHSLKVCKEEIKSNKMQKAIAFYIMINGGFANIAFGGWRRSVTANEANRFMNSTDDIIRTIKRLRSVAFDCVDWEICLERWNSLHSFAYIDSPYPDTTAEYERGYKGKIKVFTNDDYQKLINFLDEKWVGSFIMSNYPNDIVTIPDSWEVITHQQYMCCTQTGKTFKKAEDRGKTSADFTNNKRTEVLYVRHAKGTPSKDILKYYDRISEFKDVK